MLCLCRRMLRILLLPLLLLHQQRQLLLSHALEDGLARTPPMGWRSWNLFGANVNQDILVKIMDGMASRKRTVDGVPTSLCDLGYCQVGLDDNWQLSTRYGKRNKQCTYHDKKGNPIVNKERFPDLLAMTNHAHDLNLTVGWYLNNCLCHERCEGPNTLNATEENTRIRKGGGRADQRCYEGDVSALVEFGFDGVKLDACGWQLDLDLWHSLINATDRPVLIEACHWGETIPEPAGGWCPFHYWRTSGDVWAAYGSIMGILQASFYFTDKRLSRPGCWAHLDMLEVGCKGGPNGKVDVGLNEQETRAHFGAWAIMSSPLFLSHDVNDDSVTDEVWPVIANPEAIEVNQAWAGFSGGSFKKADRTIIFHFNNSKFRARIPAWMYLYKPMDDDKVAVLMINSDDHPVDLTLSLMDVPGLRCANHTRIKTVGCTVRDVWQRRDLGFFNGSFPVRGLASHDAAFLIITTPKPPPPPPPFSSMSASVPSDLFAFNGLVAIFAAVVLAGAVYRPRSQFLRRCLGASMNPRSKTR